jgi:hypothetical protein
VNLNDRLALELGRATLRAITAEAQLARAQAELVEAKKPKRTRSTARDRSAK